MFLKSRCLTAGIVLAGVFFSTALLLAEKKRGVTTLNNKSISYSVPEKPYMVLRAAGVEAVLGMLRAELDQSMALCGCPTVSEITGDLVAG